MQKGELPLIEERPPSVWLPELGPGLQFPNFRLPLRQAGNSIPNGDQLEAEGVATRKVLERAGLNGSALDLIELIEAFAAQSVACLRELGLEDANVNPKGGAIAIGHPLGASGARMVTTMIHEMVRTKADRGLATLCIGVGQGLATVIEGATKQ